MVNALNWITMALRTMANKTAIMYFLKAGFLFHDQEISDRDIDLR